MPQSRRVLVSVLNYNTVDDTIVTLRCLERQTGVSFDLEWVDNASTDDSVAAIRRAMPHIAFVQNESNTGYSGGMNSILRRAHQAGYDHVIICNNDIEIDVDAVARMVAVAESHPDAGLVGGIEVDYFTQQLRAGCGSGFSMWHPRIEWSTERQPPVQQCDFVQGAMLLFTRRALDAGVAMDERLFMYYEEVDIGFQIRRAGLRSYVNADVLVQHKADRRFLDLKGGYYQQRNRVYLLRKHGRGYHVAWHAVYALLIELPAKLVVRGSQGHLPYALACARGFRDGLLGRTGRWAQ